MSQTANLAVLVSGRGSNLKAIIQAVQDGAIPSARICAVLSDKPDAPALEHARRAGIPDLVVQRRDFPDRHAFEAALVNALARHHSRFVALAGFMRVLSSRFLSAFPGRVLNVHPSLLPSFPGLEAQRQALEAGVKISGCTVHLVDESVDGGPIVAQAAVPVEADDTPESLSQRILSREHHIYPRAIQWLIEGRLDVNGRTVRVRGNRGNGAEELISPARVQ